MATKLWQRLHAARTAADLTQQEVANACKVTRVAVGHWESSDPERRTTPGLHHLKTYALVTGAPLDWLIDDDSQIHPTWQSPEEGPSPLERALPFIYGDPEPLTRWMLAHPDEDIYKGIEETGTEVDPAMTLSAHLATLMQIPLSAHCFVMQLVDTAWAPEFRRGDGVMVDPHAELAQGDYVLVRAIDSPNRIGVRQLQILDWDSGHLTLSLVPGEQKRPTINAKIGNHRKQTYSGSEASSVRAPLVKASLDNKIPFVFGKIVQLYRLYS